MGVWKGTICMNLLERIAASQFTKTGASKKISIPGKVVSHYEVYSIPLRHLYYNDQNGRINTTYKKYKSENGVINPEIGDSKYNELFEKFIFDSNSKALKETILSIKEKSQQEPGVVLPDGRVIDGNRRFTALRIIEKETGIEQHFETVVLDLDTNSRADEKKIKELELDLQLGREERVNYDPIDRIYDVYNTIIVEKLMTVEEYKRASGAGNTKGIKRDIRLAELILKFVSIVSPGGNPIDKFYLARDLKLDGPIEEIEATLSKLKKDKESITEAVLVYLAASKIDDEPKDTTRLIRELKSNVLNNPEMKGYYLDAVDDKIDTIMEVFEENPIKNSTDLRVLVKKDDSLKEEIAKLNKSTNKLVTKGKYDSKRKRVFAELENIRDSLEEIEVNDFAELTVDENLDAKQLLVEITDILYKLKKDLKIK